MSLINWCRPLFGAVVLLLVACTVVDLDENGKPIIPSDPDVKASFKNQAPQQIAQSTWKARVLDAAQQHPLGEEELNARLNAASTSSQSVFVRLSGPIVKGTFTNDREKIIVMAVSGKPIDIQLGTVIRGNAIRDAAGFKFEDLTNQVQFAQLSREYNREAVKNLPIIDESWVGKKITALIAVTLKDNKAENAVALTLQQETPNE